MTERSFGPLNGAPIGGSYPTPPVPVPAFNGYLLQVVAPLLTGIGTPIPMDQTSRAVDPASFDWTPGDPDVGIVQAGAYRVEYRCSAGNGNNQRTQAFWWLELSLGGSPFMLLADTQGFTYHRNVAQGRDTAVGWTDLDLPAGARVRAAGARLSGGGPITPAVNACGLRITRLDQ